MDAMWVEQRATAAAGGDRDAFADLYDCFSPRLYGYLADMTTPATAEDLLHELWVKAMAKLGSRRGPVAPWLFTVARNLAIDARRAPRATVSLTHCVEVAAASTSVHAGSEEEALSVRAAVAALPAFQQEVVLLRYYSGLALADIAGILELPVGTVASRLRAAIKRLKKEVHRDVRYAI